MKTVVVINQEKYVVSEGEVWFSQLQIAKLLGKSVKTINGHIKEIPPNDSLVTAGFDVAQKEGSRLIRRKKLHYNFQYVYAIGIKAREYKKIGELSAMLKIIGFEYEEMAVAPVKEREFADLVSRSLQGICVFEQQYRIHNYRLDLYSSDLKLAIEFDERHHEKTRGKELDTKRQSEIQSHGIHFIRVKEGEEPEGLNEIIKYIIECRYGYSDPV